MRTFEYRIFNMSESEALNEAAKQAAIHKNAVPMKTWLGVLNDHGREGWRIVQKLTTGSFLMVREIELDSKEVNYP